MMMMMMMMMMIEVVVTAGPVRRAKFRSVHHHQITSTCLWIKYPAFVLFK